ncbi:LysE family translocator [Natrarchaeobius oligotrophus]|uniref:LysE family translocator n=1 Tax=Natrarchaeobius chitinivorans TaxID=1679083 RepID=A0A3N6MDM6_NATCH|nr:LysE family translocator [Natrarchaeobius chitinivorans]RQH00878.1 LysE family translocator [Natrarchaeobius chitinivorans]
MIDPSLFALYLVAAGAMILSPGPDSIYVLTRSIAEGRSVGIASAAGISVGVVVHTVAAVLGLAALFQASLVAFTAVTYLGAAYLVFLGIRTIRDDVEIDSSDGKSPASDADVIGEPTETSNPFLEAITVNVLNPQVAIFFLAFLPQFVSGDWIEAQLTLLGGIYAALTMLYLGTVAVAAGALRSVLVTRPTIANGIQWITGLVLIGLGFRLFLGGF